MKKKYYLWGAGGIGKRAVAYLLKLAPFVGIIDSDVSKQGGTLQGLPIYSYEAVKPFLGDSLVVIAHFSPKATEDILNGDGIESMRLHDFVSHLFWNEHRQNAVGFLDFPITMRCSLSCRDCMQRVPLREHEDVPIETLMKNIDLLFSQVMFVGEMSLIGGEPFLHPQFYELLEYILEHYQHKIGSLVITTNGMVQPSKEILELCRANNIFISISDYSKTIPRLAVSLEAFETSAKLAGVSNERKHWHWSEVGSFDEVYGQRDCSLVHMQLYNGRLWRCTLMAAGYYAGLCDAVENKDYHILGTNHDGLHEFLNGLQRTTQCHKCRYPLEIEIDSAIQTKGSESDDQ